MKIVYSFNKRGREAEVWAREIAGASTDAYEFLPFNHEPYLPVLSYIRAQLLDNLYFAQHPGLMKMYADVQELIARSGAEAMIVDNCFPYHPEMLMRLPIYKVMRTSDGPLSTYDRDFAYLHAYDHVLYHSPAYSRDLMMEEKLRYCGAKRTDFWPFGLFDAQYDPSQTEETIVSGKRDIDVIFIGWAHGNKLPTLAAVKRALGRRLLMIGFPFHVNAYFNLKYGLPGYVRPPILPGPEYVRLYQRTKIGFNLHNRGDYTVGSYRLFELPGNGVAQISDGGPYLDRFFNVGSEIDRYTSPDELIARIEYYLAHDEERKELALNGFRRVVRDYRIAGLLQRAGRLIESGMLAARQPVEAGVPAGPDTP
jgi:hypothetical protein